MTSSSASSSHPLSGGNGLSNGPASGLQGLETDPASIAFSGGLKTVKELEVFGPDYDVRTQLLKREGWAQVQVFLSSYIYFILSYIYNFFITFVFNWSTNLFQRPLSTLYAFVLWSGTVLVIGGIALMYPFLRVLGVDKLVKLFADRYQNGNSRVNWGSPNLIDKAHAQEAAQGILAISKGRFKHFNRSLGRAVLILAAAAYENYTHWLEFIVKIQNDQLHIMTVKQVAITGVETYIRLIFFRVVNTNKVVIVLTFKGTTPSNLSEYLTDFSFSKTNAAEYLWGCVHQGFYSKIFLLNSDNQSAYNAILSTIKDVAKAGDEDLEYTMFNTGHSLGGCLSSVFYARLLKSPEDLSAYIPDRKIHYVGSYTYGGPKIGNLAFANAVDSKYKKPVIRETPVMFTVQNAVDLAPSSPSGLGDGQVAFIASDNNPQDYLDYTTIGKVVHLHRYKSKGLIGKSVATTSFLGDSSQRNITSFAEVFAWVINVSLIMDIVSAAYDTVLSWVYMFDSGNIVNIVESLMPWTGDHSPWNYYKNFDYLEEPILASAEAEPDLPTTDHE